MVLATESDAAYNRTIEELKYKLKAFMKDANETYNRTIEELKCVFQFGHFVP